MGEEREIGGGGEKREGCKLTTYVENYRNCSTSGPSILGGPFAPF